MLEQYLEPDELAYHQKLIQDLKDQADYYQRSEEALQDAQKGWERVVGARDSWFSFLSYKYNLGEQDYITPEGAVVRQEKGESCNTG